MTMQADDRAASPVTAEAVGLAAAINQAGQAVVITDPEGNILYVNAAFTAITGYSSSEVIGRNPQVLKSGQQDPAYYKDLWKTISAGGIWHGDLINRRKDGSLYREEMTIAPVRDASGQTIRYIALKQDVTKQRETEEAHRFLAAMVASSQDAIIGATLGGEIAIWNEGAEKMFGYGPAEATGRPVAILFPADRENDIARVRDAIEHGQGLANFETTASAKNGRDLAVLLTISPVRGHGGEIAGAAVTVHDITERSRTERSMRDTAARFQALFERSLDCLYIHDFAGNFLDLNPAALKLLGYEREEIHTLNLGALLDAEQVARALENLAEMEKTGAQKETVEYRVRCKNGAFVDVETKAAVIPAESQSAGKIQAILGVARDITERNRTDEALRESEERFRSLADGCPTMLWVTDTEGGVRFVNRTYNEFFGTTYEQVENSNWKSLLHPDDAPDYMHSFLQAVGEHLPFQGETRVRRGDGTWRWIGSYANPRWSPGGEFLGHVGLSPDITERKQAEEALRGSEEKFRELTENISEVFWMMNATGSEILYISPGYEQIWGRPCDELYQNAMIWLEAILPEDRDHAHAVFERQMRGEQIESEYRIRTPLGQVKWVRDRAFAIRNQTGQIVRVVGIAEDISARKQAENELAHQARHDHLTGLPNRLLLSDRLVASIERAARSGSMTAVIYIDLDGFKFVNDSLGHEAGDLLLQQATVRLQSCIREPDTLARMGGDEFMVVINDVRDDEITLVIAERLRWALRKSFPVAGHELYVTGSLGIAMYPRDGTDVSTLRRNADAAMYESKRGGKDRVSFFTPAVRISFLKRLELEAELRRALEGEQLSIAYQPIFETQSGRQTAFEALLRWTHPVLGNIPPAKFIPVAEESGLIVRLGAWVMEEACRQCRLWQERGLAGVRVAVNVSPLEFARAEFAANVLRVLDKTGLSGQLLDLELTETTLMHDLEGSIRRMEQLRERGIRISIDDFGTGYSSLGYLPRLPVDILKIDRSFLAELGENQTVLPLIQGMISLAHSIGKRVVVEGVETAEQLAVLRNSDADELQGFLLGRPGPLPDGDRRGAPASPSPAAVVLR
jgi:diguanylate cyclase (GGDEF)-like protein/PAS domain S-box-containing protein